MDIKCGTPLRLGHLPVLMEFLRKSKLFEIIDKAIPRDSQSKVSTSQCIAVILCSVYAGAHDLWRVRERMARYDMKTIMRDPQFDINDFPEERLAKAFDDLHKFNLDKLMTSIAIQVIEQFKISLDFVGFDTTSISFYGAYESEEPLAVSTDMPPVRSRSGPFITYGHSKNKRSDLKQILYGTLMAESVPLMGQALDGNRSDSLSAAEFFARIRHLVADPRKVCCVADSKGWCARVLDLSRKEDMRVLSRLPRNHTIHTEMMAAAWKPTQRIEMPPKNKTDKPDVYEFMSFDIDEAFTIETPAVAPETKPHRETFTVPTRAIRIHSTALLRTKTKSLERIRVREAVLSKRSIGTWQGIGYACEADAIRAGERHCLDHRWVTLDLHPVPIRVTGELKRRPGRPPRRPATAIIGEHYRLTYTTTPVDKKITKKRLHDQSTFILIRTRNKGWNINDTEMIPRYKGLYHNENGFAWLKSGAGLNPVFLHTPRRIASLCFVYCLGLMAWNLIQREVRSTLKKTHKMLPYHRGKPSNRITTRFLFELFQQVMVVPFTLADGETKSVLAGFDEHTENACNALNINKNAFKPV